MSPRPRHSSQTGCPGLPTNWPPWSARSPPRSPAAPGPGRRDRQHAGRDTATSYRPPCYHPQHQLPESGGSRRTRRGSRHLRPTCPRPRNPRERRPCGAIMLNVTSLNVSDRTATGKNAATMPWRASGAICPPPGTPTDLPATSNRALPAVRASDHHIDEPAPNRRRLHGPQRR